LSKKGGALPQRDHCRGLLTFCFPK
jgi:hypothetical protein